MNMNTARTIAAALAALALTACGGSGGSGTEQPPVVVTPSDPGTGTGTTPVANLDPGTTTYDAERQEAFEYINAERLSAGLGVLQQSAELDLAATWHADYLTRNNLPPGHVQDPLLPGFEAATTHERGERAGYKGGMYEGVASGMGGAIGGVFSLISTPYHRIGLLEAGLVHVGIGYAAGGTDNPIAAPGTLSISSGWTVRAQGMQAGAAGVSVYPGSGAAAVPILMGGEIPNPVPELGRWGIDGTPGFTVSVHVPQGQNLTANSFTLNELDSTGGLVGVEVKLLDQNDPIFLKSAGIKNWAFIVPLAPLKTDAVYEARFTGSAAGKAITKVWRFSTVTNTILAKAPVRNGAVVTLAYQFPSLFQDLGAYSVQRRGCADDYGLRSEPTGTGVRLTETTVAAVPGCTVSVTVADMFTGAKHTQDVAMNARGLN